MKSVSADLARVIERLKSDSDDFPLFMKWLDESFSDKVNESLDATADNTLVCQGYLRALRDIRTSVANSRETLDRTNKHRDSR